MTNFATINPVASRSKKWTDVPSLSSEVSQCGIRAVINAEDAVGMEACNRCGLFHEKGKKP